MSSIFGLVLSRGIARNLLLRNSLSEVVAKAKSNRSIFREIPPDRRMLAHLDKLRLGYLPKRRERVAVAKRYDGGKYAEEPIPFPFYRHKGMELNRISDWKDIPVEFPGNPPEVAVIGRSNVGKSTLLNSLVGFDSSYVQRSVVTDKPGETKQLHFFQLGKVLKSNDDGKTVKVPALMLVDMPGFGFAFMKDEDKLRCNTLCMNYLAMGSGIKGAQVVGDELRRRTNLKRVLLVIDARHGIKIGDIHFFQQLHDYMHSLAEAQALQEVVPERAMVYDESVRPGVNDQVDLEAVANAKKEKKLKLKLPWKLQIILTKCDLLERADISRRVQEVRNKVAEKFPYLFDTMLPILPVSGKENKGVLELQRELASLVSGSMDEQDAKAIQEQQVEIEKRAEREHGEEERRRLSENGVRPRDALRRDSESEDTQGEEGRSRSADRFGDKGGRRGEEGRSRSADRFGDKGGRRDEEGRSRSADRFGDKGGRRDEEGRSRSADRFGDKDERRTARQDRDRSKTEAKSKPWLEEAKRALGSPADETKLNRRERRALQFGHELSLEDGDRGRHGARSLQRPPPTASSKAPSRKPAQDSKITSISALKQPSAKPDTEVKSTGRVKRTLYKKKL